MKPHITRILAAASVLSLSALMIPATAYAGDQYRGKSTKQQVYSHSLKDKGHGSHNHGKQSKSPRFRNDSPRGYYRPVTSSPPGYYRTGGDKYRDKNHKHGKNYKYGRGYKDYKRGHGYNHGYGYKKHKPHYGYGSGYTNYKPHYRHGGYTNYKPWSHKHGWSSRYNGYQTRYRSKVGISFHVGTPGYSRYRWAPTNYAYYTPAYGSYSQYTSSTQCQRVNIEGWHKGHREVVSVLQCSNPWDGTYIVQGSEQIVYCPY